MKISSSCSVYYAQCVINHMHSSTNEPGFFPTITHSYMFLVAFFSRFSCSNISCPFILHNYSLSIFYKFSLTMGHPGKNSISTWTNEQQQARNSSQSLTKHWKIKRKKKNQTTTNKLIFNTTKEGRPHKTAKENCTMKTRVKIHALEMMSRSRNLEPDKDNCRNQWKDISTIWRTKSNRQTVKRNHHTLNNRPIHVSRITTAYG